MATKKSAPQTNVRVRFNSDEGKWETIDKNDQTIETFDRGYMTDVSFSYTKTTDYKGGGCGSRSETRYVGIANGTLVVGTTGRRAKGMRHMTFNTQKFVDEATQEELGGARHLMLMPERKALYLK